jgi:hypothetical protein
MAVGGDGWWGRLRSHDGFDDDDSAPPTAGRRQRDDGGRATTTTTTHAAIPASRANASIEGMTMMAQAPAAAIVAPPT